MHCHLNLTKGEYYKIYLSFESRVKAFDVERASFGLGKKVYKLQVSQGTLVQIKSNDPQDGTWDQGNLRLQKRLT